MLERHIKQSNTWILPIISYNLLSQTHLVYLNTKHVKMQYAKTYHRMYMLQYAESFSGYSTLSSGYVYEGSKFKVPCYEEVVCPNLMHSLSVHEHVSNLQGVWSCPWTWLPLWSSRGRQSSCFCSWGLRREGRTQKGAQFIFPLFLSHSVEQDGAGDLDGAAGACRVPTEHKRTKKTNLPDCLHRTRSMKLWLGLCLALLWVELQHGERSLVEIDG